MYYLYRSFLGNSLTSFEELLSYVNKMCALTYDRIKRIDLHVEGLKPTAGLPTNQQKHENHASAIITYKLNPQITSSPKNT